MKIVYQKQKLGKENRIPIKLFLIYIVFTFIFFAVGPIKYEYINNYFLLVLFMSVFLVVGFLLFNLGTKILIRAPRFKCPFEPIRFVKFSLVYSVIMYFLMVVFDAKNHGFSFSLSVFYSNFFTTMAETYTDVNFITSPAKYMASYTTWIEVIALVGGVYYFRKLKPLYRFLFYAVIFLHVFDVVFFVGSQKQLMDILIYISIPFFIKRIKNGKRVSRKNLLILIFGLIAVVLLLGNIMQARSDLWTARYNSKHILSGAVIDKNNFIYKILPSFIANPFVSVMRYLSQGYRGLALCLTLPFEWSMGFGSSFKWMNDFSKWFSVPLSLIENSYPVRMEEVYHIKAYASWHTIFPWFASDFTWLGAIIIVSAFLFYWGKAWREALKFDSLPALLLFSHLCIFVIYIPCNNQLFQTRVSIITTVMIILIWYLYHGVSDVNEYDSSIKSEPDLESPYLDSDNTEALNELD